MVAHMGVVKYNISREWDIFDQLYSSSLQGPASTCPHKEFGSTSDRQGSQQGGYGGGYAERVVFRREGLRIGRGIHYGIRVYFNFPRTRAVLSR